MRLPDPFNPEDNPLDDAEWVAVAATVYKPLAVAVNDLVAKGCDRAILVRCAREIAWAQRPRVSNREVRRSVARLFKAADCIRRLDGSDVSYAIRYYDAEMLAADIEEYGYAVQRAAPLADKRSNRTRNRHLRALVKHIEIKTGKPHDKLVAVIVSYAPDVEEEIRRHYLKGMSDEEWRALPDDDLQQLSARREDYSAQLQLRWRRDDRKYLKKLAGLARRRPDETSSAGPKKAFGNSRRKGPRRRRHTAS